MKSKLPSGKSLSDDWPFIAYLFVKMIEYFFLLLGPLGRNYWRIQVIVIPTLARWATFLDIACQFAIWLQIPHPWFSQFHSIFSAPSPILITSRFSPPFHSRFSVQALPLSPNGLLINKIIQQKRFNQLLPIKWGKCLYLSLNQVALQMMRIRVWIQAKLNPSIRF
jgi:hypothetical protein